MAAPDVEVGGHHGAEAFGHRLGHPEATGDEALNLPGPQRRHHRHRRQDREAHLVLEVDAAARQPVAQQQLGDAVALREGDVQRLRPLAQEGRQLRARLHTLLAQMPRQAEGVAVAAHRHRRDRRPGGGAAKTEAEGQRRAGRCDRHLQVALAQRLLQPLPVGERHRNHLQPGVVEQAPLQSHRQRGDVETREVADPHRHRCGGRGRGGGGGGGWRRGAGGGRGRGAALAQAALLLQEADQLAAQAVILGVLQNRQALARPRERHREDLADAGLRTVGHHHDAVGKQQGFIHIVGHHHGGDAGLLADLHQLLLQVAAGEGIEGAEGLIEQQQPRPDRQGAGNRHPLLHASRQLGRKLVGRRAQPHQRQVAVDDLAPLAGSELRHHPIHRQGHVLAHGLPGQQRIVLEHHHPVWARLGDLPPLDQDAAAAGLAQARQQVEQGALAAAGVPDQRNEFAFAHLEIDVLEGYVTAAVGEGKTLGDVVDGEKGGRHAQLPPLATSRPTQATRRSRAKPTKPT